MRDWGEIEDGERDHLFSFGLMSWVRVGLFWGRVGRGGGRGTKIQVWKTNLEHPPRCLDFWSCERFSFDALPSQGFVANRKSKPAASVEPPHSMGVLCGA